MTHPVRAWAPIFGHTSDSRVLECVYLQGAWRLLLIGPRGMSLATNTSPRLGSESDLVWFPGADVLDAFAASHRCSTLMLGRLLIIAWITDSGTVNMAAIPADKPHDLLHVQLKQQAEEVIVEKWTDKLVCVMTRDVREVTALLVDVSLLTLVESNVVLNLETAAGLRTASWGPLRIDLFARSSEGELLHKWRDDAPDRFDIFGAATDQSSHSWHEPGVGWLPHAPESFESLGVGIWSAVSSCVWGDHRIDVVGRGGDGSCLQKHWTPISGWCPSLTEWSSLGGISSDGFGLTQLDDQACLVHGLGPDMRLQIRICDYRGWYPPDEGWLTCEPMVGGFDKLRIGPSAAGAQLVALNCSGEWFGLEVELPSRRKNRGG